MRVWLAIAITALAAVITAVSVAPEEAAADADFRVYDTAWEVVVYSSPGELDSYTSHLATVGFDGFWISVAPHSGQLLNEPNHYGDSFGSFSSPNRDYFEYIDLILDKAAQRGLKVGMVVGWANAFVGDAGAAKHGGSPPLNTSNAYSYGQFLGARYSNHPGVGMWVMGGDYYTASDETENFGVWENLISGLESKGANQPIAYHGHFYVSGLWNQGFFDIAAPLTGHCRSPGEAASALNSVKNQVGGRPVYAGEMRYEGFLADFCNGPDQVADEYDIEDDTRVAIDGGMAGIVYGHDQRWDWSPNPIGSLGSAGERRMLRLVEPVAGPDARDDYLTVIEGGSARIAVLNNDERATGVSIDTQPDHGTVTVDGNEITYEHDGSENHSDEFDYRASGPGGSDRARVSVSVEAQNDAPVAIDDSITVVEGATTSIDLAANDIDPDGPSLSVSIALQPTHGTLELTGTTVVYSHLGGENLEDSFSYQLSDGQAADSAVVDVVIVPSNDLPTLEGPDSLEVIAGSPVTSSFQLSDEDGDQVALQVTAPPEHGTLEIGGATVIYTPDARYVGIDSFSMRAGDGIDYSPEHIVTLNVLERGTGVSLFDPATGSWSMPMRDGSVRSFFFGDPGDQPLLGDWDCDGIDTVGMFRPSNGFVYISNSNAGGFAEQEFFYGIAGDIALVGDWDGNGCDTLAVYRSGRIYLSNFLGTGPAESDFFFGIPGDRPFAGDFDGDGRTGIGLYRQQTGFVYVRNEQSTGVADNEFFYGLASDRIVAGDWDRDGTETVGIFRPSESAMYLSNTNGQGDADVVYQFGTPADLPLAGIVSQSGSDG